MFNYLFKSYIFLFFIFSSGLAHAAYINVDDTSLNNTWSKALETNSKFDDSFDKNATNPWDYDNTHYFHTSVQATEKLSGGRDWYSFAVNSDNVKTFLDIDGTNGEWRSWIGLYDSALNSIGFNDTGEVFDEGSRYPWDSFLFVTLKPGKYYVAVGRDNNQPLLAGQNYVLNIGVGENRPLPQVTPASSQVPVPAGLWLFGSAFASLALRLTKKSGYRL